MRLNKRGVMFVTDICNMKCKFCYYAYSTAPKNHKDINALKQLADILRFRYDLTHVDLTGMGEPTLYPHIKEIVKYCDEIGLKPTVITNGQRTDVIKELIEDGHLEDVVLSIHSIEKAYEELTRGRWEKLLETLQLLKDKKFNWRGNVCVVKDNLSFLKDTIEITHKYGGRLMNFLVFNPHAGTELNNQINEIQATYTECAEAMKRAIDRANELGVMIEVRYIPICTMKGYEKYVLNFSQWIYDPYSWEEAHGNALPPFKEESEAVEFVKSKTKINYKQDKCNSCALKNVCDGVYPQYIKKYGPDEFEPFDGEPITNALHYRIQYMEENPEAYSEDKW